MATVKKRYTIDKPEFEIYTGFYDNYAMKSDILNSETQALSVHSEIWDKMSIMAAIYNLVGDEKGMLQAKDKYKSQATIPATEIKLLELEARFVAYCDRREDEGYRRPTKWPPNLLTERLQTEAYLDIKKRELEALNGALKNVEVKEKEVDDSKLLMFGPLGNGRLRNGELVELDYQPVQRVRGNLLIMEGPYKGMLVSMYREYISEPWCEARHKERKELQKKFNEQYLKTGHSDIIVPRGLGLNKVSRGSLPKWPENCKNFLNGENKK